MKLQVKPVLHTLPAQHAWLEPPHAVHVALVPVPWQANPGEQVAVPLVDVLPQQGCPDPPQRTQVGSAPGLVRQTVLGAVQRLLALPQQGPSSPPQSPQAPLVQVPPPTLDGQSLLAARQVKPPPVAGTQQPPA
jgi:hypothetical protein